MILTPITAMEYSGITFVVFLVLTLINMLFMAKNILFLHPSRFIFGMIISLFFSIGLNLSGLVFVIAFIVWLVKHLS